MALDTFGKNADHADAAFGCSDQSLSPDGELLPQPLCGRFTQIGIGALYLRSV